MKASLILFLLVSGFTFLIDLGLIHSGILGDDILGGIIIFFIMPILSGACLILQLILWWRFRKTRFAKIILLGGIILANWQPIQIIIAIKQFNRKIEAQNKAVQESLNRYKALHTYKLIQLDETEITIGNDIIGLHLNIGIDVPYATNPEPFCSRPWGPKDFQAIFYQYEGNYGIGRSLSAFNLTRSCTSSSVNKDMTTVHLAGDFYPEIQFIANDKSRLCEYIVTPHSVDNYPYSGDLNWAIKFIEPSQPIQSKTWVNNRNQVVRDYELPLAKEIRERFNKMSDSAFWEQARQNLLPEHLQSLNYHQCNNIEPSKYYHSGWNCYCAQ